MRSSSSHTNTTIVASTVAISTALFLLNKRRVAKKKQRAKLVDIQSPSDANKIDQVAYVRIRTSNLEKAVKFYTDLGLVRASDNIDTSNEKYVLLKSPIQLPGQPLLLLEFDPTREVRIANASDVGYARICLLVKDVYTTEKQMKLLGYEPISKAITDRPGSPDEKTGKNTNAPVTIIAYRDCDYNMVELVSLTGMMYAAISTFNKLNLLDFPAWVHVNINTTSFEKTYEAYNRGFGFVTDVDYGRVVNTLYQALNIADPGIAKQVQLIKLPKTNFSVDLIEWEDPQTTKAEGLGSSLDMAITVKDVAQKIDELCGESSSSWSLSSAPKVIYLPKPLGRAIHASISDEDGTEVSLVSFSSNLFSEKLIKSVGGGASIQPSSNKVVLITGCDSGFGKSTACQLAGLGFEVVAACYTAAGAQFLNDIAKTVIADLTTEKGLKAVIDVTTKVCSGDDKQLWGVVNNAGMCHPGHVLWTKPVSQKSIISLTPCLKTHI